MENSMPSPSPNRVSWFSLNKKRWGRQPRLRGHAAARPPGASFLFTFLLTFLKGLLFTFVFVILWSQVTDSTARSHVCIPNKQKEKKGEAMPASGKRRRPKTPSRLVLMPLPRATAHGHPCLLTEWEGEHVQLNIFPPQIKLRMC